MALISLFVLEFFLCYDFTPSFNLVGIRLCVLKFGLDKITLGVRLGLVARRVDTISLDENTLRFASVRIGLLVLRLYVIGLDIALGDDVVRFSLVVLRLYVILQDTPWFDLIVLRFDVWLALDVLWLNVIGATTSFHETRLDRFSLGFNLTGFDLLALRRRMI